VFKGGNAGSSGGCVRGSREGVLKDVVSRREERGVAAFVDE